MHKFIATIKIIGVNPFVFVPKKILKEIFKEAGKNKGPIPICGTINSQKYKQTLVKFKGDWRLYINTSMLKHSPKKIGETVSLTLKHDDSDRTIKPHPKLLIALAENKNAGDIFKNLPPYRKHEIIRYISHLKTESSIDRNIKKAIEHLSGKNKFAGREKP